MRGAALLLAGIALAACQPASGEPEEAPPLVDPGPVTSAEAIEGIYRVAGLNGEDLYDANEGFAVSITADEVEIDARCARGRWSYRFEKGVLVTERLRPNRGVCRRADTRWELMLGGAFDGPLRVSRTEANGLLFESATGSVTLFSQ